MKIGQGNEAKLHWGNCLSSGSEMSCGRGGEICDDGRSGRSIGEGGHTHFAPLCRIAITPSIEIGLAVLEPEIDCA